MFFLKKVVKYFDGFFSWVKLMSFISEWVIEWVNVYIWKVFCLKVIVCYCKEGKEFLMVVWVDDIILYWVCVLEWIWWDLEMIMFKEILCNNFVYKEGRMFGKNFEN